MSDVLLCDATTGTGKPCKNRSVGTANGRDYCRIASHKAQVEAMEPPAAMPAAEDVVEDVVEDVPEKIEEPSGDETPGGAGETEAVEISGPEVVDAEPPLVEAVEEPVEEPVEEIPEPEPEPEPEPFDPSPPCPSCGHMGPHRHKGGPWPAAPGSTVLCEGCLHRWTL